MPSERVQRQIDRLLDETEAALARLDWGEVRARANAVLALDPENADARTFLDAADRAGAAAPAALRRHRPRPRRRRSGARSPSSSPTSRASRR